VGLHQCRSEKNAQGEPIRSLHVSSHVPSHAQTAAKVRGFSPTAPGFTAETDSAQEGGVSCELVSENAKFPASRVNTGNFIDSGLGGASEAAKKGMKSVSYGPIPYAS
jgi:hypothetical protein